MACKSADDTRNEEFEKILADGRAMLAEMGKARTPGLNQPQSVIKAAGLKGKGDEGPFQGFGHFLKCVKEGGASWQNHPTLKSWVGHAQKTLPSGMNETVGSDGGVLVPPVYANQILMRTYDNPLLAMTTMFPLGAGNSIRIPAVNETSRANGSRYGGVTGYWRSEAGTLTASLGALELVSLTLDSLTVAIRATQELLDDATALESYMNTVAPAELAFKIGDAIVNGDGVTKPLGLLNSPSKIAVSKQTGQAAATITARNINTMWSRLHLSCRANAVWLYDQSIEPQLDEMTIGTASAQMPVYLPPGGLSAARYGTIKGRPAIPVEFCSALGTEGDIILTDLATFLTATKGGVQSAVSMHLYFLTNEQVFRWVVRIDGRSWYISSLSPKSGGASQSNIVVLETRS